ncbi:MAG: TonB-dependent receptor [Bacteroidota bacterium]
MTYKSLTLFFCFSITVLSLSAQKYTISGYIKDATNGEDLGYAAVLVTNLQGVGVNSNAYGFYSLSLPPGEYTLAFQYMGFARLEKTVTLKEDMKLNVELDEEAATVEEVVVTAQREDQNISRNEGSVTQIDIGDMKKLPVLAGEPDVIKIMETNPGIKPAGEGNAGFYVRGGGLDQNLVLLDEAPVYNPSHFLGFFSVFNGDALKSATLYKGGMPAEYGGRTSSVMDIRMKDGNSKKLSVSGGLGLIASRLMVEGPLVTDKGSFMVSGRRTYADLFLGLSSDEALNSSRLNFYDLNAKANYRFGEKDRVYLSGYFGRDNFGFDDAFGLNWGNATGTLRWNHLFSDKLFSNTTLIYSNYDYEFSFGEDEDRIAVKSVIEDYNFKQDFGLFVNDKHTFKFGVNVIHHTIEPGNIDAGENTGFNPEPVEQEIGLESAVYVQHEYKVTPRLNLNYGLRYTLFNRIGSGTEYEFDDQGNILDQTEYEAGEWMTSSGGLEPRLSANYNLDASSSLKLGYNRSYQFLHLLTNATSSSPTDVWIMSSNTVKPQIADQISLGYFRNFSDNTYETSVEVYYKDMQNAIEYRNGANVFFNDVIESELVFGDGRSYGLEMLVRKKKGKLTGWVAYTLSRTLRQFDQINNGDEFPARQDRIHDISVVAMYEVSPKVTLTANFLYYTGDAVTFPSGRYTVEGTVVPYYTERNGYRMPDYHRLDLGLTWLRKKTEKFESSWNFSLYNAYGRENAFTIGFQPNEDNPQVTEAVQTSLFRWVPSATYNFKF